MGWRYDRAIGKERAVIFSHDEKRRRPRKGRLRRGNPAVQASSHGIYFLQSCREFQEVPCREQKRCGARSRMRRALFLSPRGSLRATIGLIGCAMRLPRLGEWSWRSRHGILPVPSNWRSNRALLTAQRCGADRAKQSPSERNRRARRPGRRNGASLRRELMRRRSRPTSSSSVRGRTYRPWRRVGRP